jgi:hypothetical protein
MALDPRQAETFWPLYREYRNEMARVNDRYVELLVTYADNYDASRTSSRPGCSASTWTLRVIRPAWRERGNQRHLVLMFALSAGAIALFYGAGLMYGRHTHLSMVEYWR